MSIKIRDMMERSFSGIVLIDEIDTQREIDITLDGKDIYSVSSTESGFIQGRDESDSEGMQIKIKMQGGTHNSSRLTTLNNAIRPIHLPSIQNTKIRDSCRSGLPSSCFNNSSCWTYDHILDHLDSERVSKWIEISNENVGRLSIWISNPKYFCEFFHFWLSILGEKDQRDALKKEYDQFFQELQLALSPGMPKNEFLDLKLKSLMKEVIQEYPDEFCGTHKSHFFLSYLIILTSKDKSEYKKLLSDVKCKVSCRQHMQSLLSCFWETFLNVLKMLSTFSDVLAIRSFVLTSLFSGIVDSFEKHQNPKKTKMVKNKCLYSSNESHAYGERILEAIRLSYIDVINYLIKSKKVELTFEDEGQKSLFFHATVANSVNALRYLLGLLDDSNGHVVNKCAYSGNSPLHAAVNMDNIECTKLLLDCPFVDINKVNVLCHGATPLHLAVMHDRLETVEMLIEKGADPTIMMNGMTPVQIAQEEFAAGSKIIKLLENHLKKFPAT